MEVNGSDYVLVVDPDDELRSAVVSLLEADGLHGRGAGTGDEGLRCALEERPQLVLLDVNLPGMCGYDLLRRLRDMYGDALAVIFMSADRTESFDRVAGLLLGADDYLNKPFSPDELLVRIRRLLRSSVAKVAARMPELTTREREVLELLAAGRTQPEIASSLVIAPKTCAKHIERILEKLDVHSRAQAVAIAYRDDLLAARR